METGLLDRDLPTVLWWAPRDVRLSADGLNLEWNYMQRSDPVETAEGVLTDFVKLIDSNTNACSTDRVLDFTKRWGPLMICEHGIPLTHNENNSWDPPPCFPLGYEPELFPELFGTVHRSPDHNASTQMNCWEPVEAWNRLARHIRGILGVAAAIQEGITPSEAYLRGIAISRPEHAQLPDALIPLKTTDQQQLRNMLATAVDRLMQLGNVRPRLVFDRKKPDVKSVQLGRSPGNAEGSPFSAIALHTLFAVAGSHGVAVCSACGSPFVPENRRPQSGKRRYCPACRDTGAAVRQAVRDYRARKKTDD